MKRVFACALLVLVVLAGAAEAAKPAKWTRKEDIIYGRKFGTALTMDVFTPEEQNGAAVIVCISGGWVSNHDQIQPAFAMTLLNRGYTVFAVVHGSQPKFTIPECVEDVNRAVRYIRTHADDFKIDPNKIGITGASAGGHLSLMLGCAGCEGDPKAKDPVDRASSCVQAVACFFPPTDFLNYGEPGVKSLGIEPEHKFKAPFDFQEFDAQSKTFEPVDLETREKIVKEMSPIYHVNEGDAPALIMHGDADDLVPLQQSEIIIERFKQAGVPAELVVKKGAGHGVWPSMLIQDFGAFADWFDKHLLEDEAESDAKPREEKPAEQVAK
jgi:acetyl esterase/lipase